MDYYEELALTRAATEEEIRRSHRRLTKLFHPDQQTDEALKRLAEIQMRRLNAIVATLTDSAQRELYDEQLRGGPTLLSLSRTKRAARRSWRWWLASTLGAILLTAGAVFLWSGRRGTPTVISDVAEVGSEPKVSVGRQDLAAATSESSTESVPDPSRTVARVSTAPGRRKLTLPASTVVAPPSVPAANIELIAPPKIAMEAETASLGVTSLPAAPKPEPVKASYTHATARPIDPLEGEWIYAPKEPEKKKSGFYPPEFIDMKLAWNDGGLHGQYRARYRVTSSKPIQPDVNFTLAPDRTPRHFTWQSATGSQGTLRVKSIEGSGRSIQIEWETTKYVPGNLTAGTATLVRRSSNP